MSAAGVPPPLAVGGFFRLRRREFLRFILNKLPTAEAPVMVLAADAGSVAARCARASCSSSCCSLDSRSGSSSAVDFKLLKLVSQILTNALNSSYDLRRAFTLSFSSTLGSGRPAVLLARPACPTTSLADAAAAAATAVSCRNSDLNSSCCCCLSRGLLGRMRRPSTIWPLRRSASRRDFSFSFLLTVAYTGEPSAKCFFLLPPLLPPPPPPPSGTVKFVQQLGPEQFGTKRRTSASLQSSLLLFAITVLLLPLFTVHVVGSVVDWKINHLLLLTST
uniref:Uncharacterized protein n=1 Tax=Anopheles coluzzii TaxID=1518534 RepID=A0A8W7PY14_ANOCL